MFFSVSNDKVQLSYRLFSKRFPKKERENFRLQIRQRRLAFLSFSVYTYDFPTFFLVPPFTLVDSVFFVCKVWFDAENPFNEHDGCLLIKYVGLKILLSFCWARIASRKNCLFFVICFIRVGTRKGKSSTMCIEYSFAKFSLQIGARKSSFGSLFLFQRVVLIL